MPKGNMKLFINLLIIATLFLGIAYANIANIDLEITGDAQIDSYENVSIIGATLKENLNNHKDRTKIITAHKTVLHSVVELNHNKDASVTFTITLKNNTSNDLYFIEIIQNDDFYVNSNGTFNNQIVYELIGLNQFDMIAKNGGEISFDIIFHYDDVNSEDIEIQNEVLDSYLNFRFREVYNITYIGFTNFDYIDKLVAGEEYVISFVEDVPENVSILGDVSYFYIDGVLTLKDVKSDVVITKEGDED